MAELEFLKGCTFCDNVKESFKEGEAVEFLGIDEDGKCVKSTISIPQDVALSEMKVDPEGNVVAFLNDGTQINSEVNYCSLTDHLKNEIPQGSIGVSIIGDECPQVMEKCEFGDNFMVGIMDLGLPLSYSNDPIPSPPRGINVDTQLGVTFLNIFDCPISLRPTLQFTHKVTAANFNFYVDYILGNKDHTGNWTSVLINSEATAPNAFTQRSFSYESSGGTAPIAVGQLGFIRHSYRFWSWEFQGQINAANFGHNVETVITKMFIQKASNFV